VHTDQGGTLVVSNDRLSIKLCMFTNVIHRVHSVRRFEMAHRCQQTYTTGYDYEMHNHYLNFKRERFI